MPLFKKRAPRAIARHGRLKVQSKQSAYGGLLVKGLAAIVGASLALAGISVLELSSTIKGNALTIPGAKAITAADLNGPINMLLVGSDTPSRPTRTLAGLPEHERRPRLPAAGARTVERDHRKRWPRMYVADDRATHRVEHPLLGNDRLQGRHRDVECHKMVFLQVPSHGGLPAPYAGRVEPNYDQANILFQMLRDDQPIELNNSNTGAGAVLASPSPTATPTPSPTATTGLEGLSGTNAGQTTCSN